MKELEQLLHNIDRSYPDFVGAILQYAGKKPSRLQAVLDFIKGHPEANSSDVVLFVSQQPDFAEDAAYMSAG